MIRYECDCCNREVQFAELKDIFIPEDEERVVSRSLCTDCRKIMAENMNSLFEKIRNEVG